MPEALRGALLALTLCALAAHADEPPPAVPLGEAMEEEAVLPPGYEELPSASESTSDGHLTVSVNQSLGRPPRGYLSLEVVLHNTGPAPRVVRIEVSASMVGAAQVSARVVEVGARQRVSTWMLLPAHVQGGVVHLESPGLKLGNISFYSTRPSGRAVLVLGSEEAFQAATTLPRQESDAALSVRFLSAEREAPRELAAYVGYPEVVVTGDVTALPADVWSALEAYAATGGVLTLLSPPRDVATRLPLMGGELREGTLPHGFGHVRLCAGVSSCTQAMLENAQVPLGEAPPLSGPVLPAPPPNKWNSNALGADLAPLLPGVQAPVGHLLGFITLFVLLVGPGGLALARRRGPLVLLVVVPAVALGTCLALVAWSVFIEGFELHAARYSVTRLDRERDRALTIGIGGYYANLEPAPFQVPVLGALLSSDADWETRPLRAELTQGMSVTGGFLSPRTYQEWGEVALSPSRVRLVVRPEGEGLKVLNALGAPLVSGILHARGAWWTLPALAEGAEGLASPRTEESSSPAAMTLGLPPESEAGRRLPEAIKNVSEEPLPEGHFIARLDGPGATFMRALPVRLHEGVHLVRGRVDGP